MEFQELINKSKQIKQAYDELNRKEGFKSWELTEYMEGLVGDTGDLSKLIMARRGFRFSDEDVDDKIAKELTDCLWSIVIISTELNIDLDKSFQNTLKQLQDKLEGKEVL